MPPLVLCGQAADFCEIFSCFARGEVPGRLRAEVCFYALQSAKFKGTSSDPRTNLDFRY